MYHLAQIASMGLESGRSRTPIRDDGRFVSALSRGRLRDWQRVALGELALMPIGIDGLLFAGAVECGDLIGAQIPAFGGEILAELLFVAGSDDDRGISNRTR